MPPNSGLMNQGEHRNPTGRRRLFYRASFEGNDEGRSRRICVDDLLVRYLEIERQEISELEGKARATFNSSLRPLKARRR